MDTLAEAIAAEIEELARRFPTWSEAQAVRAYLLRAAYDRPDEDIRRELQLRPGARVGNLARRGRILVKDAVKSQLITWEDMRGWLRRVRKRADD